MGAGPIPARAVAAVAALAALLVAAAPASAAKDPGRWKLVKATNVPLAYSQGVTATASRAFVFDSNSGLFATSQQLRQRKITAVVIPPDVQATEGYDHMGDLTYDRAEGGRLLLPLECYKPGGPGPANHCGTGSIGVADPSTLAWRYYVKLDPRDIKKAMWAEVTPDGRSLWTQAGSVLLRYAMKDVARANAGPTGKVIRPVQRLKHALPPGQMDGAAFAGGRLFVSTQATDMQIWSIDLRRGTRRLEIDRPIRGESEGITTVKARGGTLHWLIAPFDPKNRPPTYGAGKSALLTFAARR